MPHPLVSVVRATIRKHGLVPPGSHVLLAVSGGQDSLAMLHVLHSLQSELRAVLSVAHVHHGLRPEQADKDAAYVAQQCYALGLPYHLAEADARAYAHQHRMSVEAAARCVRHEALARLAEEHGAALIALGHTLDDRAETVLLNIVRGTGIAGLAAMRHRDGSIIRPMLDCTRHLTGDFCTRMGLVPCMDAMNRDPAHLRVRLRQDVLPYLTAYGNPSVSRALVRLAELAQDDNALLEQLARQAATESAECVREGELTMKVRSLLDLHPALQRRVVRHVVRMARGTTQDVSREIIDGVLQCASAGRPDRASWTLPNDCTTLTVGDGQLRVVRTRRAEPWYGCVTLADPPSHTPLPDGRRVSVTLLTVYDAPARLAEQSILIPVSVIVPPLQMRTFMPGDRVRPLGLGGSKKVSDCFTDRKIPRSERHRTWLLTDGEGILWIPGVAADERVRICNLPCQCLRIAIEPAL